MKLIPAGQRRHSIQIWRRTAAAPAAGGLSPTVSYVQGETHWAAIAPLSQRELLLKEDSEIFAETTHRITCLYPVTAGHNDQIRYNGRVFEILGEPLNIDELNRQLVFLCVERTPNP